MLNFTVPVKDKQQQIYVAFEAITKFLDFQEPMHCGTEWTTFWFRLPHEPPHTRFSNFIIPPN